MHDSGCPVFERCGGCSLRHLDEVAVAELKRQSIVSALAATGLNAAVAPARTIPERTRRRAKLAFTRTKKAHLLGYHAKASHTVIGIDDCPLLAEPINAALDGLAQIARIGAPRSRTLSVAVTASETGLDVAIDEGKELDLEMRGALAAAAEKADIARLTWNGEPIATRRSPMHRFGKVLVAPPPGAFLQASAEMERMALEIIREELGAAERVADLFCGCGTFTLPLLEQASVIARDSDAALIAALERGWRETPGLKSLDAQPRDLFRRPMRAEELKSLDAVIFDPPRAGADAQSRALAESAVPLIIGVSCNPTSFARDAAILASGGYRLERVVPIDQFRWSDHVELVAVFRAAGG